MTSTAKISSEFTERLNHLRPQDKVQAVVLLRTLPANSARRRLSPTERQAILAEIRKTAEFTLSDIDRLLQRHHAKRLTPEPDALGSILVEATRAGINALASSPHVKAILENQPVSLVR